MSSHILEGLSPEQREAVTHGEGPLLVVAGAGTGKTTVIAHRIAHLIAAKRARPEEILALTFTEKAAEEMEARVDLLVPYGYVDFWIGTFHAFGNRVLREHGVELGLPPELRVLSSAEQLVFVREHLFEFSLERFRPLANPTRYLQGLLAVISRAKDEDVSPEEYLTYARSLAEEAERRGDAALADNAARELEIARFYQRYEELMRAHGYLDFGDQIRLSLELLRRRPSLLELYRKRFRYILVDEFQDTNYAQFQLLRLLAGPRDNLTVVGDDDQSIYKFRGAAISNILSFRQAYPRARVVVLTRNFRSTQPILDAAYRLIRHNDPERLEVQHGIDKRLQAVRGGGGVAVRHLHFEDVAAEADQVAELIEEQARGGRSYSEVAILVRSNQDALPFLQALNARGIPWRFSGNQGLYDQPEVRLLVAFLRVLADFNDGMSLYEVARRAYGVDAVDLQRCMARASRERRSLHDVLFCLEDLPELSPGGRRVLEELRDDLRRYLELASSLTIGQLLYRFLEGRGILRRLLAEDQTGRSVRNVGRFFQLVEELSGMLSEPGLGRFVEYLNELARFGDNPPVAEAEWDEDAVNVLTVHKAKGLEFPVVFMVALGSKKFPAPSRQEYPTLPDALVKEHLPQGDVHLQEERRLFYVGMTRAKDELYLTSSRLYGRRARGRSRPMKVSRFVAEALDLSPEEISARRSTPLEVIERHGRGPLPRRSQSRPIPEGQPLVLSYYQVDDYITCPLKYKYVHILRVPILQHHTVAYGSALHQAVEAFLRQRMQGRIMGLEELWETFARAWTGEGFLSREHEEQRFKMGREVLKRFWEAEVHRPPPAMVEHEFSVPVGRDRVVGRWDRVDLEDGGAVIIDYKSTDVSSLREANRRARQSLQLAIYALAYREIHGRPPRRVELRFLDSGLVGRAMPTGEFLERARRAIEETSRGIRAEVFEPRPGYESCTFCACRRVCEHKW